MFEILKVAEDKVQLERLVQSNEKYKHLDYETATAIQLFVNEDFTVNSKGETDMCKAIQDMKEDALNEGKKIGRENMTIVSIKNYYRRMSEKGFSKEEILKDIEEDYLKNREEIMKIIQKA